MIPNRYFAWRATRLWLAVVLIALFASQADTPARAANFSTLEIATKSGVHIFSVEMAATVSSGAPATMVTSG